MIEPLLAAVRVHVLDPLADPATNDRDTRIVTDFGRIDELMTGDAGAIVVGVETRPETPEVGNGAGRPGSSIHLRHEVAIPLFVTDVDRRAADGRRNAIVLELVRLAVVTDWLSGAVVQLPDQYLERVTWSVDYSDLEAEVPTRSYATLSLVFTTDWTP